MRTMNFEQMESVNGGNRAGRIFSIGMAAWGGVLAYGLAAAPATAGISVGVSVGVGLVWSGLSIALCDIVGDAR